LICSLSFKDWFVIIKNYLEYELILIPLSKFKGTLFKSTAMTRQQLEKYMAEPWKLDEKSLPDLIELAKEFPYFQTAWMLIAKNLKNIDHLKYPHILRTASAYAGDRKKLKQLIEGTPADVNNLLNQFKREQLAEKNTGSVEPLASESLAGNSDQLHKSGFSSIPDSIHESDSPVEKKNSSGSGTGPLQPVDDFQDNKSASNLSSEIISRFIREEPRISQPKHEFFNPVDNARQSTFDHDDMVTETLAEIYASQGMTDKSIKIFEKLIVIIPEKSSYFAGRIKELQQIHK
jgi:tetratricopeptide (TPR) repeat protein